MRVIFIILKTLSRFCLLIINFFILIGEFTETIFSLIFIFPFRSIYFIIKITINKLIYIFEVIIFELIWIIGKYRQPKIKLRKKRKFLIKIPKLIFPRIVFGFRIPRFFFLKFRYFTLGVIVSGIIFSIYQSYIFIKSLPSPNKIGKINYSLSTHIYDRNGNLLYEIYRDQNRTPIRLNQLPKHVIEATLVAEDKDFYKHQGVSFVGGIARAIKEIILTKNLQGGSTITQQLVKTALLTPERTISRKIKEIILALWTEKVYSKNQILEMYFNQVPYGGAAYGIEEASKTYFNKSSKDLTLAEAALLAGLPQAPSYYSPYNNPKLALRRRNLILESMYKEKKISKIEYQKAISQPLGVRKPAISIKAPHFVFYVRTLLEDLYGIKMVEEGGLRVYTTLDLEVQNETEKIVREEIEKLKNLNVTNGAVLVTKPKTGEIIAMVGSVDYFLNNIGAYNVTTSLRQPGSAIKPIMYSLALEKEFTAATILDDSPVVFQIPGSQPYRPVNYDGRFHGRLPLRYALANSYNVPAVKVLSKIGVDKFVNHAKKMGITTWNQPESYGLSLTLGGGEVKMTDMAVAFGVFANQGDKIGLNNYLKIEDSFGKILKKINVQKEKVLDEGIAFIISDILSDNLARQAAFGYRSFLEIPGYRVAVKTGTTDDKRDNWTIGYTPDFLVAVWVGNNDNSPMHPSLTSGVTGAAPIWNRVMSFLIKKYGYSGWFSKPESVVERICYFGRKEFFLKGTENQVNCQTIFVTPQPSPSLPFDNSGLNEINRY